MTNEIIGGQAVSEGVMMINGKNKAIAVRNPKGEIVVKKGELRTFKSKILKWPFIRGVFNLIYMMVVGIKALNYSTSVAYDDVEEEDFSGYKLVLFMMISVAFALALFKFLPLLLTKYIVSNIGFLQESNILPNILDGILKISIFIFYIYLMTLSKNTKRIFEYHGAEHKVVRCREAKKELTVENVKPMSRLHPRCGTAFIFGVFLISIVVYNIIPFNDTTFFQNFILRLLLLPVIMGISYEVLRISGKTENIFFKIITAPGLWMQKLTTIEPDEKQIEVAIKSMKAVL